MKKALLLVALVAIIASLLAIIPLTSHAANCVNSTPKPTPRSGPAGPPQDLPDGGKAWVGDSDAGLVGPNGYLRIDENKPRIYGYEQNTGTNGFVDPNGAHPVCLSVLGNEVEPL